MDIVIRGGTVVSLDGARAADVGIEGEQIAVVGSGLRGEVEIDATGCLVLPGGIDPHVHLQMAQGDYVSADDFASGTIAAAYGGTTTVIDFVEPRPGEMLLDALALRRAEADARVAVDYGLHMTIPTWHASHPETLDVLPQLVAQGVTSFKLYMAYDGLRLNDVQLYTAMQRIAQAGGLPIVHCENGPVCDVLRVQAVEQGKTAPVFHAHTRPPRQEAEATGRLIDLAALAGSPAYIVHVSCEEALDRVRQARTRGEPVAGETCPQYLFLDMSDLEGKHGERFVCAPPLRSRADRQALWTALVVGDLDVLATDHCPFTAVEKAGQTPHGAHADFRTIPGGLPSVEARLSLARAFGQRYGLTRTQWVAACCTRPASIFGLSRKGRIEPGFDADLVVFDPASTVEPRAGETLHERVDWSPYQGYRVQGWPRDVFSRGRAIVLDGELVGGAGWGRFVSRGPSSLVA